MPFWRELKRRNVYKVGAAYAIVAWLLIQVADTLLPAFGAPAPASASVAASGSERSRRFLIDVGPTVLVAVERWFDELRAAAPASDAGASPGSSRGEQ